MFLIASTVAPKGFIWNLQTSAVPEERSPLLTHLCLTISSAYLLEMIKNVNILGKMFTLIITTSPTFAAKYDRELTKNSFGVYTFRLQGQVYHFLNSLVSHREKASSIQLYFFDTDKELARRVDGSSKLRESTLRLLMRVLSANPYAHFLKDLRAIPDLDKHKILLNCNPGLDQRIYNLPSASQVAAI